MESETLFARPTLLKASDIARILNISKAFAYQLMQKGDIPTVKIGGARRVRPEDLERYIQENISHGSKVGLQ